MAKNSILDYDTTPDNNTDMGGIGIQGTSAVNNFDNAFRTLMSQIADFTGGSTIASGTTTDLSTVKGQYVTVSGTSTITSFGTAKAGWMKFLRFSGVATITYNATSMILPGAASITTAPGDYALFVSEGSGNWRCLNYFSALSGVRPTTKGQIYGLTLSNNAGDAVNDIDISAGECATDSAIPSLMILASSLTKRLDAAWAVGTGNGGLDTGTIGNNTYHVWLIQRSDTGVVDALLSLSATSPTMPTSYDRKRRIGSIIRSGGTILGIRQSGNRFYLVTPIVDRSSAAARPWGVVTLSVPSGIVVRPMVAVDVQVAANVSVRIEFGNGDGTARTRIIDAQSANVVGAVANAAATFEHFYSTTSSEIYAFQDNVTGTPTTDTWTTFGWVDTRSQT